MAVLLPRLLVFPWSENLYGDAVIRTELAERWASSPHWISSFSDGAYQFGPLQIYLVGLVLKARVPPEAAGRVVSLLFGALATLPLYSLTRRLFGWRAGLIAGLSLCAWGLHIQMSTTGGSEAVATFLVLAVLALVARAREGEPLGPLMGAAALLNLACATRYDCWLLVPLLCLFIWLWGKDRIAATARAVFFGLLCLPFPLLWMQGNEVAMGSAFYPIRFIEDFHRHWYQDGVALWGQAGYRLQNLFFWPGAALLTLSPLVAGFGMWGMRSAWRERADVRWLLWVAWLPSLYFTFKSTVLSSFVPLARFAVNQIVLLLPFVGLGFDRLFPSRWARLRLAVGSLTVLVALVTQGALCLLTFRHETSLATSLRPVSPISTNPPSVMRVARFLKEKVALSNDAVILDTDPFYWDMQMAFFSGLPESKIARLRWDTFDRRSAENHPRYLVRAEHGDLAKAKDVLLGTGVLTFRGERYLELPGFPGEYHVYLRE
jgi:4-amino-4-deoxy-L-arabinose transferase-like glycosyltransferase